MKKLPSTIKMAMMLIMVLCSITGFSQKINFSNIKLTWIQYPLYPLPEKYSTYHPILEIVFPDDTKEISQLVNQYLKIPGYKKTSDNADLTILVTFGDFKQTEKTLHTDDVYNINAGKNMTGYLYKIGCDYPVNLTVASNTGEELLNQAIEPDEKYLHFDFGKWEYSQEALDSKYENESGPLLLEKQKDYITRALSEIRNILNSYYGKSETSERFKIASGKGRGYDYTDLDEAVIYVEKAFAATVDPLIDNEALDQELKKSIEIWRKRIEGDETDGNKEGTTPEIRQMLFYNCALAYMWRKEFDLAKETIEKARTIEDRKIPKNHIEMLDELEAMTKDLEKRYQANKTD